MASVLESFPHLRTLRLGGCQKLSADATSLLLPGVAAHKVPTGRHAPHNSGSGGVGMRGVSPGAGGSSGVSRSRAAAALRVVDMQRCYQLTHEALSSVVAAASRFGLGAAALSHLTLDKWPPVRKITPTAMSAANGGDGVPDMAAAAGRSPAYEVPSEPPSLTETQALSSDMVCALHPSMAMTAQQLLPAAPVWSGLRVLALHNCVMLTTTGLQVNAAPAWTLDWQLANHADCRSDRSAARSRHLLTSLKTDRIASFGPAPQPAGNCRQLRGPAAVHAGRQHHWHTARCPRLPNSSQWGVARCCSSSGVCRR